MRRSVAAAVIALVSFASVGTGVGIVYSIGAQCRFSQKQWAALHNVIVAATPVPDPAKVPPAFRRFVSRKLILDMRGRLVAAEGPRPSC